MQALPNRFDNSAELSAVLEQQGWEAEFLQLDRGRSDTCVQAAQQPDVALIHIAFRNRVHQLVLPPRGTLTFGLPSRPQAPGRIGRRPLESETLTCFDPHRGLAAVSPAGFSAFSVTASRERLECLAESVGIDSPAQPDPGIQRRLESRDLARLRSFVSEVIPVIGGPGDKRSGNAARDLGSDLLLELLQAYSTGHPQPYVPVHNRHRALRRALAHIERHSHRSITVEELCRESAASISTLERAFRDQFGLSPKRYLVASRLHRVRRALVLGEDVRSIADIAADWGFWHMSKFAADYKRMFGELPSATRQAGG